MPSVAIVATPPSTPLRSSLSSQGQHSNPDSIVSKKVVKFDSDERTHISEDAIKPSTSMSEITSSSHSNLSRPDGDEKLPGKQSEDLLATSSSTRLELHSSSLSPLTMRKRSGSMAIHGSPDGSQSVVLSKSEESRVFGSKEEEFIANLIKPELIVITDGRAIIKELFLPPPPAPDISHILTPSTTSNSPSISSSNVKLTGSHSITPRVLTPSRSSKSPSSGKRQRSHDAGSTTNLTKSKEKLLQPKREKYCQPGK